MPKVTTFIVTAAVILTVIAGREFTLGSSFAKYPGKINGSSTTDPVFSFGDRNRKVVALTFDADMTPHMKQMLKLGQVKSWYNSKVIDILKQTNTPATLFLTGMWAQIYSDAVKQFSLDPLFELGNHSYSHPAFSINCYKLSVIKSSAQKSKEINDTQVILNQLTGKAPILFRFPGGCFAKDDLSLVKSLGLTVIGWDVSSTDAFSNDTNRIINHVVSSVKNGSVVVFHLQGGPFAPKTAEALPKIIAKLKEKGFAFVKVSDLISSIPGK